MQLIKFHDDYNVNGATFIRNGEYEFVDKHEEYHDDWIWVYRVEVNGVRYSVNGDCVVEIDSEQDKYNKDYTKEHWEKKITKDAMVKDGNYVKAWIKTYNINKPVKDRIEQTDYNGAWKNTAQRARRAPSDKGSPDIP